MQNTREERDWSVGYAQESVRSSSSEHVCPEDGLEEKTRLGPNTSSGGLEINAHKFCALFPDVFFPSYSSGCLMRAGLKCADSLRFIFGMDVHLHRVIRPVISLAWMLSTQA